MDRPKRRFNFEDEEIRTNPDPEPPEPKPSVTAGWFRCARCRLLKTSGDFIAFTNYSGERMGICSSCKQADESPPKPKAEPRRPQVGDKRFVVNPAPRGRPLLFISRDQCKICNGKGRVFIGDENEDTCGVCNGRGTEAIEPVKEAPAEYKVMPASWYASMDDLSIAPLEFHPQCGPITQTVARFLAYHIPEMRDMIQASALNPGDARLRDNFRDFMRKNGYATERVDGASWNGYSTGRVTTRINLVKDGKIIAAVVLDRVK